MAVERLIDLGKLFLALGPEGCGYGEILVAAARPAGIANAFRLGNMPFYDGAHDRIKLVRVLSYHLKEIGTGKLQEFIFRIISPFAVHMTPLPHSVLHKKCYPFPICKHQ